jgi:uncharacterized coiled-coil protein SlyX
MRKALTNTERIKILESKVEELESALSEVSLIIAMVCQAQDDLNEEMGDVAKIVKAFAKTQNSASFKKRDDDLIN